MLTIWKFRGRWQGKCVVEARNFAHPFASRSWATKRRRSSMAEVSLHGISTSREKQKV
jgi:hypothetical protein